MQTIMRERQDHDSDSSEEVEMVEEGSWLNQKEVDWNESLNFQEDDKNKAQHQPEDWEKDTWIYNKTCALD